MLEMRSIFFQNDTRISIEEQLHTCNFPEVFQSVILCMYVMWLTDFLNIALVKRITVLY
jgi:hypothetical protein